MANGTLNKAQIIGNLGQDPDMNNLPDGGAVARISLATTEKWTSKAGDTREHTEWHRVIFFGKLAEIARQYLHKGHKIYVEGRLRTRQWEDKNGVTRYTTEIHGDQMQMLTPKSASSNGAPSSARPADYPGATAPPAAPFNDDIPF